MIEIRDERSGDAPGIADVHRQAFGQEQEARIVEALRSSGAVLLSLVATLNGRVVGHAMYSAVVLRDLAGAGLGPLAVLREHQRQGIGRMLVDAGLHRLRDASCPFVVVVGDPRYYARFGFTPARPLGIGCEWDVPDDVFMIMLLDPEGMRGVSGLAKYHDEFSRVM